jgi:hypothetical protein
MVLWVHAIAVATIRRQPNLSFLIAGATFRVFAIRTSFRPEQAGDAEKKLGGIWLY